MLDLNVSLASNGAARISGYEQLLRMGYARNAGIYRILVDAAGEWAGLAVRAVWHIPEQTEPVTQLVVDGTVPVPALVTAHPGDGALTFEGSDGTRNITSADLRYRVFANSGTTGKDDPQPGTPAWQQLVEQLDKSVAQAETCKAAAAQSAADASAAATRAEKAQKAAEAAKGDALDAIGSAKTAAVTAVTDTKTAATKAVQAAQDTATKAVSATQSAATAAVEKKGKDVLATIPEDYSDTVARVSALESCGFVVVDGKVCMKYRKS